VSEFFPRRESGLCVEDVPLEDIANLVGTPPFVYSASKILAAYDALDAAFEGAPWCICSARAQRAAT